MVAVIVIIIVSLMQPSGGAVFCKGKGEGAPCGEGLYTQQACAKDSGCCELPYTATNIL